MQGAPYLIAAMLALWALFHCYELPDDEGSDLSIQHITSVLYSLFIRKKNKYALSSNSGGGISGISNSNNGNSGNNSNNGGDNPNPDTGAVDSDVMDDYYTLDTGSNPNPNPNDIHTTHTTQDTPYTYTYTDHELQQKKSTHMNKYHDEKLYGLDMSKTRSSNRGRSGGNGGSSNGSSNGSESMSVYDILHSDKVDEHESLL